MISVIMLGIVYVGTDFECHLIKFLRIDIYQEIKLLFIIIILSFL